MDPRLEHIERLQQLKLKPLFNQPFSQRSQTQFTDQLACFDPSLPGITTEDLKKNAKLENCRKEIQ